MSPLTLPREAVALGIPEDAFGGHYRDEEGHLVLMVVAEASWPPAEELPPNVRLRRVSWPLHFLKAERLSLTGKLPSWNDAGIRARSVGVDIVRNTVLIVVEDGRDVTRVAEDPLVRSMLERGCLTVTTAESLS